MTSPIFSGRIPPDLFAAAEKFCSETGISKTELLIQALAKFICFDLVLEEGERPLSVLEQIQQINSRLGKLEALELRLIILENENKSKDNLIKLESDYSSIEPKQEVKEKQVNLQQLDKAVDNCYHAVNRLKEPLLVDTKNAVSLLQLKSPRELINLYKTEKLPLIRNSYKVDFKNKNSKGYTWEVVKL